MRSALAGLCGLLAVLLLPLALVSVWLHTVVADTGEYLERVEPLAAEERVRDAVEEALVEGVLQRVDLAALADRLGLPPTVSAEQLVRRVVGTVVAGDAFTDLWGTAQRTGHDEVVAVLSSPDPLRRDERVVIPLDPFVDAVRDGLAGLGLPLEGEAAALSLALPLAAADDLEPARVAYRLLERLWLLLPVATVLLALVSVALARRRLRTLAVLGGLASLVCLGLLALLGVSRAALLDTSPSEPARVLTGRILDAVAADLREAAVTGVLAGLAVLVVAAVLGLGVRAVRRTAR